MTVKDEWPSCVAGGTGEVEALSDVEVPMVARAALEALAGRALVVPSLPGNLGSAGQLLEHYVPLGVEVALEFFQGNQAPWRPFGLDREQASRPGGATPSLPDGDASL